jgi:hypothetical protein
MSKPIMELYEEWMETGTLPDYGLCSSLPKKYLESLSKLSPFEGDISLFWAAGVPIGHWDRYDGFTPLRQTIMLLIAAMHDEL